uniref:Uncharacterized protein n=1 Tax=Oryza nivara TaxID=4536 RepID=A0A0E0GP60_ORYNI
MAWSPWSKGNTESNPIRAQHHGVQIKGDFANNKTCSKHELDPGDEIDWTVCSIVGQKAHSTEIWPGLGTTRLNCCRARAGPTRLLGQKK